MTRSRALASAQSRANLCEQVAKNANADKSLGLTEDQSRLIFGLEVDRQPNAIASYYGVLARDVTPEMIAAARAIVAELEATGG